MWQFPYVTEFSLPGYSVLQYKLRSNSTQGGGVGVYVKNNIKFSISSNFSVFVDRIFESIFIEIFVNDSKIIVGNIYRPGSAHPTLSATEQYDNFFEILSNVSSDLSNSNSKFYIVGDFNIDVLKYESNKFASQYVDLLF